MGLLSLVLSSAAVGAVVGYVTNVVAVKMIFHPYRPIRIPVLNVKLQGLLPSKKGEFAERIGEVAEEYLKTPEFRRELELGLMNSLKEAIEMELNKNIISYSPVVAGLLAPYVSRLAQALAEQLVKIFSKGITEETIRRVDIKRLVSEKIKSLSPEEIEEFYKRFAKKELRMIEYIGLVLGAIIGPIEAVIITLIH